MLLFSNAKINLGLQITGRRSDGYHNIETILYPIPFFDVIELKKSEKFSLKIFGKPLPCREEDNLLTKAWRLFKKDRSLPEIEIQLLKNIPVGSGLGGGSSNAAFLLKGLNDLFQTNLSIDVLTELAAELGSDVPFFIYNSPMLAKGRGDRLSPASVSLHGYTLALVIPPVSISTHNAYQRWNETFLRSDNIQNGIQLPVEEWPDRLHNDFEALLFPEYPILYSIKNQLIAAGARYTSLTGSGSAIYGIFKEPVQLSMAEQNVIVRYFQL